MMKNEIKVWVFILGLLSSLLLLILIIDKIQMGEGYQSIFDFSEKQITRIYGTGNLGEDGKSAINSKRKNQQKSIT